MADAQERARRERFYEMTLAQASRAAPIYTFSINVIYLAFVLAALAAMLVPLIIPMRFGWAIAYVAPIIFLGLVSANYNAARRRVGKKYVELMREGLEKSYGGRGVDLDRLAQALWSRNNRIKGNFIALYVVVLAASVAAHFWHAFHDVVLADLTTLNAWLLFGGRVLLFLLGCVIAFFVSVSVALCPRAKTKFTLDELRRATFGPRSDMEPVERNMLTIVSFGTRLTSMFRRVENYTLESTLIGALAFSAFVTVLLESDTPVGDLRWVSEIDVEWVPIGLWNVAFQVPMFSNFIEIANAHIESMIAAFLLASAVCFLAVLFARIQFTDAYRHADDLHAQAKWLNEKEGELLKDNRSRAGHFSRQGALILDQLEGAAKKLAPVIDFMSAFRNWGLWLFLLAIAICGLHYSVFLMAFILLLFGASTAYFAFYRSNTLKQLADTIAGTDWNLGRSSAHQEQQSRRDHGNQDAATRKALDAVANQASPSPGA